ncbi:MAG TPA: hypothetical protein VMU31_08610, partial [Rhizomicrobium sp.]|nr:hypothetical protein [Rhizomicrobium sp.]
KSGPVTTTASDGGVTHSVLKLDHGVYTMAMGATSAFRLRFFPLPSAPPDYLVTEMEILKCKDGVCTLAVANPQHYFAVAHLTKSGGAEQLSANCDGDTARKLGADPVGSDACVFPDRATLEKALRTLIGSKPVSTVNPDP